MYSEKAELRILYLHDSKFLPQSVKIHHEIQKFQTSQTFKIWRLRIPTLSKGNNTFIMFIVKS